MKGRDDEVVALLPLRFLPVMGGGGPPKPEIDEKPESRAVGCWLWSGKEWEWVELAVGGGCTAAGFCWVPVREKASLRAEKRFLAAGGGDALAFGPGATAPEMEGRVLEKEGLEVLDGEALWPQFGGPFGVGVGVFSMVGTCCRPGDDCMGRSRGGAP